MKRTTWAVVAVAGMGFAIPVFADDPPAADTGEAARTSQAKPDAGPEGAPAADASMAAVRDGAGSMEPSDTDATEDLAEQRLLEEAWRAP
jgi:hypothetical protein